MSDLRHMLEVVQETAETLERDGYAVLSSQLHQLHRDLRERTRIWVGRRACGCVAAFGVLDTPKASRDDWTAHGLVVDLEPAYEPWRRGNYCDEHGQRDSGPAEARPLE